MLVLKDVLRPRLKPGSSGGEEFQPDKYLTDRDIFYPSQTYVCNVYVRGSYFAILIIQYILLLLLLLLKSRFEYS